MAIYHFSMKAGSRSSGKSAKSKNDYINKQNRYASKSDEVIFACSENMPSFAKKTEEFWDAADLYERKNACLFKELEFALPAELSSHQQSILALNFAKDILENQPFSLAIHDKKDGNSHCHVMFSERKNDGVERPKELFFKRANSKKPELGGAKKSPHLHKRDWLKMARKVWQDHANRSLKRAGHNASIDHRSLEAQRIERAPQIHIGVRSWAMRYSNTKPIRVSKNNGIKELNASIPLLLKEVQAAKERKRNPAAQFMDGIEYIKPIVPEPTLVNMTMSEVEQKKTFTVEELWQKELKKLDENPAFAFITDEIKAEGKAKFFEKHKQKISRPARTRNIDDDFGPSR